MTTYFSVDVETSGTNPLQGVLLSVGIQVVGNNGLLTDQTFYTSIDHPLTDFHNHNSMKWWKQQDEEIYKEAFNGTMLMTQAACYLKGWTEAIEPDINSRCFVANPAAFDKMWIDHMYSSLDIENPFNYRSLCLRSMRFGMTHGQVWGESRPEQFESQVPHHALHDAIAQAKDLAYLIDCRSSKTWL